MGSSAAPNAASHTASLEPSAGDADRSADGQIAEAKPFSWLDPHPIFVIILVGAEERPFGIQMDLLCSKSLYYREYFAENKEKTIEHIVSLPNTPVRVFGHAQRFLYTDQVFETTSVDELPTYDVLVDVWKLGHTLRIEGLCERTLDAMIEAKRITHSIPDAPLLIQVWKDTPEGSSIRQLLLSWAAEYMRSSENRSGFARSLPQELLSELVVAMSSYNESLPPFSASASGAVSRSNSTASKGGQHREGSIDNGIDNESRRPLSPASKRARYNGFYAINSVVDSNSPNSRQMSPYGSSSSTPLPSAHVAAIAAAANKKLSGRTSLPNQRTVPKKRGPVLDVTAFPPERRLQFCADLLNRMLSGPGFWTRLVGPFRDPVDPSSEGLPDYFEKVKRPMDLGTIKSNIENGRYTNEEEFALDVRQIFTNVYTYWKNTDPIWAVCERLEKTFEDKYSQMNKWLSKMDNSDL